MLKNESKNIKKLLIDKDVSGAEIARIAGVERSAISHVIAGRSKSTRLRKAIADALKAEVDTLWGKTT